MNHNNRSSISWVWVILAWSFFWPLGLVLLLKKLSDDYSIYGNSRPEQRARPTQTYRPTPTYQSTGTPHASSNTANRPASSVRPAPAFTDPTAASQKAKPAEAVKDQFLKQRERLRNRLTGIGAGLTAIGGLTLISEISDLIAGVSSGIFGLGIALLMFLVPGVVLLGLSQKVRRQLKLYRRCVAIIGKRKVVRIDELAEVSSESYTKLRGELEGLLEAGALPGAYIDYSRNLLVLSSEGLEDNEVFKSAQQPRYGVTDEAAITEKDRYIKQIRQLNDEIADEALSRKIDRIEEITAKMFAAVEKDPSKRPQLASFLSYYLPTTLKILGAYRDFEKGTAHGSNISSTMHDIELATETVVKAFENQLDQLYENDALDVSTDISVLESMLAKDGLTQENRDGPHLTL